MKTCLQCSTAYDDDYVFCMKDGNALIEDGPEQETVVNRKFTMPTPDVGTAVYCVACGLANKAHSKFCKKCGKTVEGQTASSSAQFGFPHLGGSTLAGDFSQDSPYSVTPVDVHAFGETVTFQPPKFGTSPQSVSVASSSNKSVLLALAAVGVILLFGIMYLVLSEKPSPKPPRDDTTSKTLSTANSSVSPLPDTFERDYDGYVNGKRTVSLSMHLKKDRAILTGSAETSGSYDELSGSIDSDGSFQVNGTPTGQPTTGIWSGRISIDGSIRGNWTSLDGRKSSPFSVNEKK